MLLSTRVACDAEPKRPGVEGGRVLCFCIRRGTTKPGGVGWTGVLWRVCNALRVYYIGAKWPRRCSQYGFGAYELLMSTARVMSAVTLPPLTPTSDLPLLAVDKRTICGREVSVASDVK